MSSESAVLRLQQTTHHITNTPPKDFHNLSIVHGPSEPALVSITLGELLDEQCLIRPNKECIVIPWTGARWTFQDLQVQSKKLARAMLSLGVQAGDRVGILSGNCEEYAAVFFAAGYVGAILVVLNSTYTASEARYALNHSECKILFVQESYGRHSNSPLLQEIGPNPLQNKKLDTLEKVIIVRGTVSGFSTYAEEMESGALQISEEDLAEARLLVNPHDVCNLQYTSGSTGQPKAAMLTHFNMINNAYSIGSRMSLTAADTLCCPPPLFHCFGLVLGLLACLTHGSKIVFPSATFSAPAVLDALSSENCTALHGVPAMFEELLSLPRPASWSCPNLRTGIVAGAPVPKPLMERMLSELGMREFTSSYGLTEASPTCFNAHTWDTIERRLTSVGRILPHLHAKIVDRDGEIVPIGERGELCMAGYSLQKGYWRNEEKTNEIMVRDSRGILWLKTGDEAVFDHSGYCTITGRFKDIIIRGGENIYPLEIESRLVAHPSGLIHRAAVVGIKHIKYGEVVGAFLQSSPPSATSSERPSDETLRAWVRSVLAHHKAPTHIFWLGGQDLSTKTQMVDGMSELIEMVEMPLTGSGKMKKHVLRDLGTRIVAATEAVGNYN